MTDVAKRLAKAIRNNSKRVVAHQTADPMYAVVRSTSPLSADLGGTILDEDDLTLGFTVRRFDADMGLLEGDTLVVQVVGDDFLAYDVVTDRDVGGGGGGG